MNFICQCEYLYKRKLQKNSILIWLYLGFSCTKQTRGNSRRTNNRTGVMSSLQIPGQTVPTNKPRAQVNKRFFVMIFEIIVYILGGFSS